MSEAQNIALPPALRAQVFSREGLIRIAMGFALAALTAGAILAGPPYLAVVVAAISVAAAREWHRMVGNGRYGLEFVATTATIWLALLALIFWPHGFVSEAVLVFGAMLVLTLGIVRKNHPLWQAGGVIYLGFPAVAILALRGIPSQGVWLTLALFLVVWATDTGAMAAGKLIGGPKIAPVLSPNKTWAGTIGGVAAASLLYALYVGYLDGDIVIAALFGAALSVMAHLGDLFESLVKRRFRTKDSGGLIPGHGGVLDRVDSTLSAALALELAVFVFHVDPLFGARP
jgi:phosphatidate cytidylyltransferase